MEIVWIELLPRRSTSITSISSFLSIYCIWWRTVCRRWSGRLPKSNVYRVVYTCVVYHWLHTLSFRWHFGITAREKRWTMWTLSSVCSSWVRKVLVSLHHLLEHCLVVWQSLTLSPLFQLDLTSMRQKRMIKCHLLSKWYNTLSSWCRSEWRKRIYPYHFDRSDVVDNLNWNYDLPNLAVTHVQDGSNASTVALQVTTYMCWSYLNDEATGLSDGTSDGKEATQDEETSCNLAGNALL